ncbi:MAG: hypothetical protein WBM50_24825 [Acidimicrobiales bacterium]
MASAQLQLIPTDHTWKLDRHTVQVGRAGIAKARAALAAATQLPDTEDETISAAVGRMAKLAEHESGREPAGHHDDDHHNGGHRPHRRAAA